MSLQRRPEELPEDYAERARLHALAKLSPAKKRARLQRELDRDAAAPAAGSHIDRSQTALESAPGEDWADVHVLDDPEKSRPDLLAIAAESSSANTPAREHPIPPGDRRAVLERFMDYVFDRGHWAGLAEAYAEREEYKLLLAAAADYPTLRANCQRDYRAACAAAQKVAALAAGDITARIFAFTWAAFPDLLSHYCERSTRALLAAASIRSREQRTAFFSTRRCRKKGWDFKLTRRARVPQPDIAAICALGLGELLCNLDVVRALIAVWFKGSPTHFSADPALVTRRALATAFTTHPALVMGQTMEELAGCTGQVKQTFQWMIDGLYKSQGIRPATCRAPGNYAAGQLKSKADR